MGEARGVVSKEELKAYGGAEIMLLDGDNTAIASSGSASGTLSWTIRWDSGGFTGHTWELASSYGQNFEDLYVNGELDAYFRTFDGNFAGLAIFNELIRNAWTTCIGEQ